MVKLHYYQILFLLATFLTTPLHAAHYLEQEEGKNDVQAQTYIEQFPVGYYNYTLQHSKRKIDNTAYPEELEDEKKDFKRNNIVEELKNKKGAVFFMVITSNKKTEELSKLFFINRNPNTEKDAVRRVQKSYGCHVISHSNVKLSSHVAFQLLGWLQQEARKCIPIHIHASSPLCVTCHAIVLHLFHLDMPKSSKGCSDASAIELGKECPLAQKYINSGLTLALAQQIFMPSIRLIYENQLQLLNSSQEALQKKCNSLEKDKIDLQKKLEEKKQENTSLKRTNDALQNKYNDLKKEKDERKKLEEKCNKDKKQLEETINKLYEKQNKLYHKHKEDEKNIDVKWEEKVKKANTEWEKKVKKASTEIGRAHV